MHGLEWCVDWELLMEWMLVEVVEILMVVERFEMEHGWNEKGW